MQAQLSSPDPGLGSGQVPVLLIGAHHYYGTLAATRSFGRAGIPVVVADPKTFAAAGWSRFASRRVSCPPLSQSQRSLEWLLDFGRKNGKHVLCATSDDTVWLFSKYKEQLSQYFHIYQPSIEVVHRLLNKWALHELCQELGIRTPRTWQPSGRNDLQRIAATARFPLLLKPPIQALYVSRDKGRCVANAGELLREYEQFGSHNYAHVMLDHDPEIARGVVQEYDSIGTDQIYGLSGFIDEKGRCLGMRASRKVLQRPKGLGVGLCFESEEVRPELAEAVLTLCRRAGFHGMFEVEFLDGGPDGSTLIDFNPRLYNQIALDIARGGDWPLMSYYSAIGDAAAVDRVAAACAQGETPGVFTHRFVLDMVLRMQRWSGALQHDEVRYWRSWCVENQGRCTDAVNDRDDPRPAMLDATGQVLRFFIHPRSSIRLMLRG